MCYVYCIIYKEGKTLTCSMLRVDRWGGNKTGIYRTFQNSQIVLLSKKLHNFNILIGVIIIICFYIGK